MTPRVICSLCAIATSRRRSVCWACYLKLREARAPMPPMLPRGGARPSRADVTQRRMERWARRMTPEARMMLAAALQAVMSTSDLPKRDGGAQ